MRHFFKELERRNVIRVGIAYLVAAWLFIQVVETIFPAFGIGDAGVRITVITLAITMVPVLILAWVFELTPDGLKLERDVDRSQSITPKTGRMLDRIIMLVLALVLGYFAFDKFVLSESREATIAERARQEGRSEALVDSFGDRSIAVLPFADMSPNRDQEYFSDGIAEELLNLLARIPEIRVVSRTTAFSFKNSTLEISDIANRLNVGYILEGSVRKAGEKIRITAQLIEARSDTHLWSETWDRSFYDVFSIQDEIASEVVSHLKVEILDVAPAAEVTDPEAYALYLQANHLAASATPDSMNNAVQLYKDALAIDPEYAQAWSSLATVYFNQAGRSLDWREGLQLAREAAVQALSLDSNVAAVHKNLGWTAVFYEGNLEAAARHFHRAYELAPNNPSHLSDAAEMNKFLTRYDHSIAMRERLISIDPTRASYHYNLGNSLLYDSRWDEAILAYRKALTLSPNLVDASSNICVALLMMGEPEAALAVLDEIRDGDSYLSIRSMAYHAQGRTEASENALHQLREIGGGSGLELAAVHAFRGDLDVALELLRAEYEKNGKGEFYDIAGEPLFRNLHSDPRWHQFLQAIDRSPEHLMAISFDVVIPEKVLSQ